MKIFFQLQSKNTVERNKELERRRIVELVGFLATKNASDEERIGRQSGSMAWRLIRGEAGVNAGASAEKNEAVSKAGLSGHFYFIFFSCRYGC